MAEHHQPQQLQIRPHRQQPPAALTQKLGDLFANRGPSTTQVVTHVPLGGVLLLLAGLALAGTIAAPLFVLFSPVIVPAALTIGLAVAGFWTSGAFGIAGLAFFTWLLRSICRSKPSKPSGKRRTRRAIWARGPRTWARPSRTRPTAREEVRT